jgi:hypothetical protein
MPPSAPNPVFCSSGLSLVDTYFSGSGMIGPSVLIESTQSNDSIVGGAA